VGDAKGVVRVVLDVPRALVVRADAETLRETRER
jgi:hypothetical protein